MTRRERQRLRRSRDQDTEAKRYRRAADAALEQVDVCIRYLKRIRKRQLAARLERNRDWIARRLEGPERPRRRRRRLG